MSLSSDGLFLGCRSEHLADMRFARTAKDLGVECVDVPLIQGGPKQWKHEATDEWSSVENAAARYFERLGWSALASEGGLILTLIKAASFPEVKATEANVFVEAFYHQFSNGFRAYSTDWLLENVAAATAGQIERNFAIIAAETGLTPYYFPAVCSHHVLGLYETLGNDRLLAIAKIFASAPYDFRAGPDPRSVDHKFKNHRFQPGARSYAGHTGSPLDLPGKTLKAGVHGVPGGENMLRLPDGSVRYFTVRESARLQTFPDEYQLHGSWTEAMRQLGNAVPVEMAHVIAKDVAGHLRKPA